VQQSDDNLNYGWSTASIQCSLFAVCFPWTGYLLYLEYLKSSQKLKTIMPSKYEKWVEKRLYECQMFGFTSKAFTDFVYNTMSKAAGEAIIDVDKQCNEHPEFSNVLDKNMREKCFEKVKEMISKRIDINVDRLELFLSHNTFRIPENVVLPGDKIQESCHDKEEDENAVDQRIDAIVEEIKASYETRIALQKELSTLGELQAMANQVLNDINEIAIPSKEDFASTCQSAQDFIHTMKTLEQNSSQQNLVDA